MKKIQGQTIKVKSKGAAFWAAKFEAIKEIQFEIATQAAFA